MTPDAPNTEALIERLAREAAPVERLRPPMLRAALWLIVLLSLIAGTIVLFANPRIIEARAAQGGIVMELIGTLGTGVLATVAAFHLSLPDRSPRWALLPMPALALWLAGSGMGCMRHLLAGGDPMAMRGSADCIVSIIGFGVPMLAALLWGLGRARPLAPVPVALTGGLAAAAFAAFLLEFFHNFDINIMDLLFHALAVCAVVALAGWSGGSRFGRTIGFGRW